MRRQTPHPICLDCAAPAVTWTSMSCSPPPKDGHGSARTASHVSSFRRHSRPNPRNPAGNTGSPRNTNWARPLERITRKQCGGLIRGSADSPAADHEQQDTAPLIDRPARRVERPRHPQPDHLAGDLHPSSSRTADTCGRSLLARNVRLDKFGLPQTPSSRLRRQPAPGATRAGRTDSACAARA